MPEPLVPLTPEQELERSIVTRGLRFGIIASALLIGAGMLVWILAGQPVLQPFHAWGRETGFPSNHPSGLLLSAGILGLVLTPILRVVLLAWVYFRLRDLAFLAVSLVVLTLLILSAGLSAGG